MKGALRTIGVFPAGEFERRRELFDALREAFPVRFTGLEAVDGERCDALIQFLEDEESPRFRGPSKTLLLRLPSEAPARSRLGSVVKFSDSNLLDSRLRRRVLAEDRELTGCLEEDPASAVLARSDGRPVWIKRKQDTREQDIVAIAPAPLEAGEVLRDRVAVGRFLGLLPIIHFLREISEGNNTWEPPSPRASFVIDDPNLHWKTYGYLNYAELARQAEELSYHVVIATVPLDYWYSHPPTVALLKKKSRYITLTLHGNNHSRRELGSSKDLLGLRRTLAQALRRASAFEQRTGLKVSRVMVPPHEACSENALRALAQLGYEAVSMTRPYPWMPFGEGMSPYAHPNGNRPLTGWYPAELTPAGMPVLVRRVLWSHDEIVLRSYLDHPLILYGHASELASGLGLLNEAAATVNAQPGVRWCSLTDISRSNFQVIRDTTRLTIRPFSRHILVPIPEAVSELQLELIPPLDQARLYTRIPGDTGANELRPVEDRTIELEMRHTRDRTVEIVAVPSDAVDPTTVPDLRLQAGPFARRVLAEAQQRMRPSLAQLKRTLRADLRGN